MKNRNEQMDYGDMEFSKNVGVFCDMLVDIKLGEFLRALREILQKSYEDYKDKLSDIEYMDKGHIARWCNFFLYDINETFGIALEDDELNIEKGEEKELERRLELIMQDEECMKKLKSYDVTPEDLMDMLYKKGLKGEN